MVYLTLGPDTYRSREWVRQVAAQFKAKADPTGANLVTLSGKVGAEALRQAALSGTLLARRRLVIIRDLLGSKLDEATTAALAEVVEANLGPEPSKNVLVFWEQGVPDQRLKAFKLVGAAAQVQRFELLAPLEAERWVTRRVAERGSSLDRRAATLLVTTVGPNLWALAAECEKLAAYRPGGTVSAEDVGQLVVGETPPKIFDLLDALGVGDPGRALGCLDQLIASGEEPLRLLAMLRRQVRLLCLARDAAGQPSAAFAKAAAVHPFVAQKLLSQARHFSWPRLSAAYRRLLEADAELKSNAVPAPVVLTGLVARL